jgi:hypothetical protein
MRNPSWRAGVANNSSNIDRDVHGRSGQPDVRPDHESITCPSLLIKIEPIRLSCSNSDALVWIMSLARPRRRATSTRNSANRRRRARRRPPGNAALIALAPGH